MPSLYLGKIGKSDICEIHAVTKDLPFREFGAAEIADTALFREILAERYRLLESGRPIYCTAVSPNRETRTEQNPHDDRPGTVHIVALNREGRVVCSLSVAVDIGETDGGTRIGLPLENLWRNDGYPEGANQDRFRERYLPSNYGQARHLAAWEMAELYRHVRSAATSDDLAARIGLYTGCYHLLVREAVKKGCSPTWIWVFDAIPSYFDLYRWAGLAALRDLTVADPTRWLSPHSQTLRVLDGALTYCGEVVSRSMAVPIPSKELGGLQFSLQEVSFLDGVIDLCRIESLVGKSPVTLTPMGMTGFGWTDRFKARMGLTITGRRRYEENHGCQALSKLINRFALKTICPAGWEFNTIGDIPAGPAIPTNGGKADYPKLHYLNRR